jgi:branched-chain amino acid transport system ATP-binding protein
MTRQQLVRHPVLWMALILGALTLHAMTVGSHLAVVTEIVIYVLYGAGLNVMLGYTGLVPFGASVFFGVGSYLSAIAIQRVVGNEIEALIVAMICSAGLALALGALVLLRRGLYFSLLTLACSQIAFEIAFKWTGVTGGENGLQNVPRVLFPDPKAFHLFCLLLTVLAISGIWRLAHSPLGRTFQAIRENEERARSLGYDVYLLKLCSFTISGSIIGLAGALLAFLVQGAYANNLS